MVSMVSVFRLSFSCFFWLFVVGFRLHTQEKKYVFFFLVCFCLSRREFCVSQNVYLEIMNAVYGFYGFCVSFVFPFLMFFLSRGFSFTHTREKIRVFSSCFSCLFLSLKKGILCFSKCIPGNNEGCLWFLWFLCFVCLSLAFFGCLSWVFVYTHKRKNTCFFFLFVFVSQEGNFVFLKMYTWK